MSPVITVTDLAAGELRRVLADADFGDEIHLVIDSSFQATMELSPRGPDDLAVECEGVTLLVDPATAGRAEGLVIDFVKTPEASGFRIDNPNAPPRLHEISAKELQARMISGEINEVFDVRTLQERAIATIEGTRHLDEVAAGHIDTLDKETPLAFVCHHGIRSRAASNHFLQLGFRNIYNLSGGIDAWSMEVDTKVPRY